MMILLQPVPNCALYMYCSLVKDRPWVEHLTSLSRRGVGSLVPRPSLYGWDKKGEGRVWKPN